MPVKTVNLVRENSATTGTGTFNLSGVADSKYQTFVAGLTEIYGGSGPWDRVLYKITDPNTDDFELGEGTITDAATDTLARDTVIESSNGGAKVSFGPGDKIVSSVVPAQNILNSLVHLATLTASASASLDFTALIDSTYDAYLFVLDRILPATNATQLCMRVSEDGGSTFKEGATDYEGNLVVLRSSEAGVTAISPGTTYIPLTGTINNAANDKLSGEVWLYAPARGSQAHNVKSDLVYENSIPSFDRAIGSGTYNGTTNAIDAVRFFFSSGNITSGNIRMYGVRQ